VWGSQSWLSGFCRICCLSSESVADGILTHIRFSNCADVRIPLVVSMDFDQVYETKAVIRLE